MTDKISKKDRKDWESFLTKNETLLDKELTEDIKSIKLSRTLDLHGFSLEEANKKVESFLNTCFKQ